MDGRLRDAVAEMVVEKDTFVLRDVVLRDAEDAMIQVSSPYPAAKDALAVQGLVKVAFSSDGTHMAVVTMDSAVGEPGADTRGTAETSKIQVIDLEKRLGPFTLKVDGKVDALAFAREGGKFAAGSTKGDSYFLRSWTEDTWIENRDDR